MFKQFFNCIGCVIIAIICLILGGVILLGYWGFIPEISKVIGTNKPRDLEVFYDAGDISSFDSKTDLLIKDVTASAVNNSQTLKADFTQEEITAALNKADKETSPITDCQFKINENNEFEISGIIHKDKLKNYLERIGYYSDQIETVLKAVMIEGSKPFYLKGELSVTNNEPDIKVKKIEIGRFPLPSTVINVGLDAFSSYISKLVSNNPGFEIKSLKFDNGVMHFEGSIAPKK